MQSPGPSYSIFASSRARWVIPALVVALNGGTAWGQAPEPCCAQVIISGSEAAALEPASRAFRVWIDPESRIFGWRASFPAAAREAFDDWSRVNLPVEFSFVSDSSDANLLVLWRRRFDENTRGRSTWWTVRDLGYVRGEIEISVAPTSEWRATDALVRAMALHEIGHLLGLRHDTNPGSVMARSISVRRLSQRDVQRARSLYAGIPAAGDLPAVP